MLLIARCVRMPKKTKAPTKRKTTKYDTHIKPFLEEIKQMYELGYTELEIYKTLRIGKDLWIKSKKENKELKEALNQEKRVKKELENLIAFKETILPIEEYNNLLNKSLEIRMSDEGKEIIPDPRMVLTVLRQQHPTLNQFFQFVLIDSWVLVQKA